MIGYDVSYRRGAFVVEGDPKRDLASWSAYCRLDEAIEQATKSVLGKSGGRWMIHKKRLEVRNDDIVAVLMVIVPAGSDQREQLLAAVNLFEETVAERLGAPLDTTLRDIEEDGPKCEICNKKPDWVRRTAFSGSHFFCTMHAEAEGDFGDNSSNNMFWQSLEASTT